MADLESRVAVLEETAASTKAALERIERRLDTSVSELRAEMGGLRTEMGGLRTEMGGLDARLRQLEVSVAAVDAKFDLLTTQIVAKLPSWWQMPAVIAATIAVLVGLAAFAQHIGLLPPPR